MPSHACARRSIYMQAASQRSLISREWQPLPAQWSSFLSRLHDLRPAPAGGLINLPAARCACWPLPSRPTWAIWPTMTAARHTAGTGGWQTRRSTPPSRATSPSWAWPACRTRRGPRCARRRCSWLAGTKRLPCLVLDHCEAPSALSVVVLASRHVCKFPFHNCTARAAAAGAHGD